MALIETCRSWSSCHSWVLLLSGRARWINVHAPEVDTNRFRVYVQAAPAEKKKCEKESAASHPYEPLFLIFCRELDCELGTKSRAKIIAVLVELTRKTLVYATKRQTLRFDCSLDWRSSKNSECQD
ncbi:hypothetical protein ARMSODRAFT_983860 [Armillaria solidipes]|uniref:Uncharacterized protein n=1 Tax=Armillaria solidipes TaxID=1076256 RepID=A0A2H3AXC0_9AGAR|nr:hypothetical protein ARMSODRAFT_983860 [Armillaria solidipes]